MLLNMLNYKQANLVALLYFFYASVYLLFVLFKNHKQILTMHKTIIDVIVLHKRILCILLLLLPIIIFTIDKTMLNLIFIIKSYNISFILPNFITHNTYHLNIITMFDNFMNFMSFIAEGWALVIIITTLILFNSLAIQYYNNTNKLLFLQKFNKVLELSLITLLYSGLFNLFIKLIINRQRPSIEYNNLNFFNFILSKEHNISSLFYASNSMPSGHTITAIACIMPLYIFFQRNKYIKYFLITIMSLMSFSRIYTINHWFSDVYCAIILGIIIAYGSYKHFFDQKISNKHNNMQ